MTSPHTDPLSVPENRELLIALLDSAASRYRRMSRYTAPSTTADQYAEDAQTAEMLSEHFLNECDRG